MFAKKRGLIRKAGPPVHDDHVRRDFTATLRVRLARISWDGTCARSEQSRNRRCTLVLRDHPDGAVRSFDD